jgi:uncharacterized protein with predicted RNA binding PUA domain
MLRRVRVIADYQFGRSVGSSLFPEGCEFILSKTGRVRQVLFEGKRLATVRAGDGRLTLGCAGAARLHRYLPSPAYRVAVMTEVAEFIAQGKNVFAKHVVSSDPGIRAGDEVLIVAANDRLIATGSAVLSGEEMLVFKYGAAVSVRHGRFTYVTGRN